MVRGVAEASKILYGVLQTDFGTLWLYQIAGWGAQRGNRLVSFLRAYARSGCLVELDLKFCWSRFPLSLLVPGGLGAFPLWSWVVFGSFPFPFFVRGAFPFPFPHPQTSYPTLVGLMGTGSYRSQQSRNHGNVGFPFLIHGVWISEDSTSIIRLIDGTTVLIHGLIWSINGIVR